MLENLDKIVSVIGWPALVIAAWRASAQFQQIKDDVANIRDNHLKHIDADLQLIKSTLLKNSLD